MCGPNGLQGPKGPSTQQKRYLTKTILMTPTVENQDIPYTDTLEWPKTLVLNGLWAQKNQKHESLQP